MAKNVPAEPSTTTEATPVGGKGHATPTRREREAANKRPLVPSDRKAASKESRAKVAEQRERARVGMANGEERYLLARDRGPERRFARDWMDARFMIGELTYPAVFILFLSTFFLSPSISGWVMILLWGFVGVMLVDDWFITRKIRAGITARFGAEKVPPRLYLYVLARGIQFRALRTPKPQVKRGQYPA